MRHDPAAARRTRPPESDAVLRSGSRLAHAIRGAFSRYRAWRRRRIAVRHLSELDDYLLRDIGITRAEVFRATRYGRPQRHD